MNGREPTVYLSLDLPFDLFKDLQKICFSTRIGKQKFIIHALQDSLKKLRKVRDGKGLKNGKREGLL